MHLSERKIRAAFSAFDPDFRALKLLSPPSKFENESAIVRSFKSRSRIDIILYEFSDRSDDILLSTDKPNWNADGVRISQGDMIHHHHKLILEEKNFYAAPEKSLN